MLSNSLAHAKQGRTIRAVLLFSDCLPVEAGVYGIDIPLVLTLGGKAQAFTETLIVDDLAFAQETDDIVDIGIVREPEDVVIDNARLLLRCKVLVKIAYYIALDLHCRCGPWCAGSKLRVYAGRVIDKISFKPGCFNFVDAHFSGKLLYERADHLKVVEFFGTCIVIFTVLFYAGQAKNVPAPNILYRRRWI